MTAAFDWSSGSTRWNEAVPLRAYQWRDKGASVIAGRSSRLRCVGCEGAAYLIATGAAKVIGLGAAKVIGLGAAKVIALA
jgi:hypothetical protein